MRLTSPALKIADFRILLMARALAVMSLQAQAVIVGWHVYELTKDPLILGLIGLTEALPAIGFAFLSGHVVDKRRPAAVYRVSVMILVINALLIWITVLPDVPLANVSRILLLFCGVFVSGMIRSFTSPSVFAMISHIIPRRMQAESAAWSATSFQLAAICGPALGGVLYGAFGAPVAFAMPPAFMLCALLSTFYFSKEAREKKSKSVNEPFMKSILAGIRFASQQKVLLSAMTLDMFSILFGGAVAILPMFSDQVLHAGSVGLGFLRSAPSFGSALTAIFLAYKPLTTISGRTLLLAVAGFGLSIIAFAFSTHFILAFMFLCVSGIFDGVSLVIRSTILQLLTPENMRGRVSSLSTIFITSSNELGAFESGVAARLLGLIPSLIFGGVVTLIVVTTTAWVSPELRRTRIVPGD